MKAKGTPRDWIIAAALLILAAAVVFPWSWNQGPAFPEVNLASASSEMVEAVESAKAEVRRAPRSGRAWGELGMVLFANDYGASAHECFVKAEHFEPDAPWWPYFQARRLMVDDRAAAEDALRRAVARAGRDTTPRLALAETLFERDEHKEATALCRQVLALEPDNPRAEFILGLVALAEEKVEQCIEHLTRTTGSPFAGKRSALYLASAYQRLGEAASAQAFLRRAREAPEDRAWPDAYVLKAQEYAAGPVRHFQQAQKLVGTPRTREYLHALRELAEESGDGVSHYRLGLALAKMNDYAAAEPVLRTALRKSPNLIGAHYLLGISLLQQGEALAGQAAEEKFEAAARSLRRAIELKPTHGQAHLFLGRALEHSGMKEEALAEFRVAVKCCPEVAEAQLALGEALAAREPAEARRHLELAQSLAPDDPRAAAALGRLPTKSSPKK